MKLRPLLASLAGSLVVYAAMVACSSPPPGGASASSRGASSSGSVGSMGVGGAPGRGGAGGEGLSGGSAGHGGAPDDGGPFDVFTDPTPDAMANENGARLKAAYHLGDDGARDYVPGMFWDSLLGMWCKYGKASDGVARCLPYVAGFANSGTGIFSDPGCTVRIFDVAPANFFCGNIAVPFYAQTDVPPTPCGGSLDYVALIQIQPPPMVYSGNGMTCDPYGPPTPGLAYATLGAVVPPSTFVAFVTTHD